MKNKQNEICIEFDAISENEGLARVVIAAFLTGIDPTIEQIEDVKTAVSEAVTNAIIHAYEEKGGKIVMHAIMKKDKILELNIYDRGIGIEDVELAMQPMFTTGSDTERSGMGFSFMEVFMDGVEVESSPGKGTTVHMWKSFDTEPAEQEVVLQTAIWNNNGGI